MVARHLGSYDGRHDVSPLLDRDARERYGDDAKPDPSSREERHLGAYPQAIRSD
jgi:hypothetical protein